MVRGPELCNPGNFISCTQLFNPDKPVSMFFDARVAIDPR
jgi:hypothetical protein